MSVKNTTIVLGLQHGDEGKGKITLHHSRSDRFTHCFRFNGSSNAGHSVYLNGQKVITHIIPTGILFGLKGIIGPGCVLNEKMFFEELEDISKVIPNASELIRISFNTHIVSDEHIKEELTESKIGTTRRGVGPSYRDKYARIGKRAEQIKSFEPFIVDVFEELYQKQDISVLCEGAQAINLDIDWGDYPFVSSSHCGVGSVVNNGIPYTSIKSVEGVIKCYETYVGSKQFQDPNDPMLDKIGDLGQEFGATTGRRRQVNYIDLNRVNKAIRMNSVNILHINKMDILRELNCWKVILNNEIVKLKSEKTFKKVLKYNLGIKNIKYYYSPE